MKRMAQTLNKDNSHRLYKNFIERDEMLKNYYKPENSIKDQKEIYNLLKSLPLKLEIKGNVKKKGGVGEVIAIGFVHDSLKNYFLVDSIKNELVSSGKSETFSARNLVDDI